MDQILDCEMEIVDLKKSKKEYEKTLDVLLKQYQAFPETNYASLLAGMYGIKTEEEDEDMALKREELGYTIEMYYGRISYVVECIESYKEEINNIKNIKIIKTITCNDVGNLVMSFLQ